eukprot:156651-Alexandrium_andersonii.AAC.1
MEDERVEPVRREVEGALAQVVVRLDDVDLEVVLNGADGGDGPRQEGALGLRGPVLALRRCTSGQRDARLQEDAGRLHEPGYGANREGVRERAPRLVPRV